MRQARLLRAATLFAACVLPARLGRPGRPGRDHRRGTRSRRGADRRGPRERARRRHRPAARVPDTGPPGSTRCPASRPAPTRSRWRWTASAASSARACTSATGERLRLDVDLALGDLRETTTVTADAPLLQTESSSLGEVIANRSVVQLPLNGRSFLPLVALVPGVALPPGSAFPRLNGGRPRVNEYLYDGISVLQPEPGTVPYFPDHRRDPGVQGGDELAARRVRALQRRRDQPEHEGRDATSSTAPPSSSCATRR